MSGVVPPTNGHWRYAVKEVDEDGDVTLWTTHGVYDPTPFTSEQEVRDWADGWLDNYTILRAWHAELDWQPFASGPEPSERDLIREMVRPWIDDAPVDHIVTQQNADELIESIVDQIMQNPDARRVMLARRNIT